MHAGYFWSVEKTFGKNWHKISRIVVPDCFLSNSRHIVAQGQFMKKVKTDRDRLIGALGGAGGALALIAFFNYLFYPSWRESTWVMNLFFGIIGTCLILAAVFVHVKRKDQVAPTL